jgi:hypothetical protein
MYISPSPFGGTKHAEYMRSIELLEEIFKTQGIYFALAFLNDSGYDRQDISNMMHILEDNKK